MQPEWLPNQLVLNGSSLTDDYDKLYEVFKRDLLNSNLRLNNYPVRVDTSADSYLPQYERGFMHLVTCDDGVGGRTIDYKRAVKINWVKPVIENYTEPEVYAFWYTAPKGETLYLWMLDSDFIVILRWMKSAREKSKVIVTAYHVDSNRRKYFQGLYGKASKVL